MDKDIRFIFDPRSWALLFQIQFIADTFCLSVLCLHLEIDIPARRRTSRALDGLTPRQADEVEQIVRKVITGKA
jgi:hypothetical protein